MLALGVPAETIAAELGVARKTIDNWRTTHGNEILAAADERMESVVATVVDAAASARSMLAKAAPEMAQVAIDIALDDDMDADYAPVASVRLRAAMTALDRAGVPALTKLEHSGEVVSEATLEKLKAALRAAK